MDGDSMGRLIHEHGPEMVTGCLTQFASKVVDVVQNQHHSGICVYAGGDDLLAMLPSDHALEAVAAVRKLYLGSFSENGIDKATISAGLVFAHYRCAFSRVLEYAHELLDDHAKEGAGRDAVAIGVLKPGGVACEWAGRFDNFTQEEGRNCFTPLIQAYVREPNRDEPGLSSSFLYNLQQRFAELFDVSGGVEEKGPEANGDSSGLFDKEALQALLVAEYLHGRRARKPEEAKRQLEEAKGLMRQLEQVCWRADGIHPGGGRIDLSGARLVKFLAIGGKEGAE
jgi:CRISPR-associated protein Cmr2